MRIPVIRVAPVVLPFLLLSACAEMGAIVTVQRELQREFGVSVTDVRVTDTRAYQATGRELQLVVAGERLDAMDAVEREAEALRMAELVRDRYPGFERLSVVTIAFEGAGRTGAAALARGRGYRFRADELGRPAAAGAVAEGNGEALSAY
jgi:hypothetical protein